MASCHDSERGVAKRVSHDRVEQLKSLTRNRCIAHVAEHTTSVLRARQHARQAYCVHNSRTTHTTCACDRGFALGRARAGK